MSPIADVQSSGADSQVIVWHELGTDENQSMPLGNGDIALNAWTEQNGDLVMLIAKGDAFSENAQLLKLGRVRVSLSPNPFVGKADFTQRLTIEDGRLELRSGGDAVYVWVDANEPVVRVSAKTQQPVTMTVHNELWRTRDHHLTQEQVNKNVFNYWEWRSNPNGIDFLADTVLPAGEDETAWCHFNKHSMYPVVLRQEHLQSLIDKYADPLLHRCFGVLIKGKGFVSKDNMTLVSSEPSTRNGVSLYALTEQTSSATAWMKDIRALAARVERIPLTKAWTKHSDWWTAFWNRSWVRVAGSEEADKVTVGYAVNRYMLACMGRCQYPMKFNGGLFTVGHDIPIDSVSTTDNHDPDFRDWGSCFWNQNIRHIYYPLVATGDYDLLMPWFDMYTNALPLAKDRTRLYYGHGGASFIETIHFFGLPNLMDFGWDNPGNDPQSGYMKWHTQGALEIVYEMLDYYDNTQDAAFLKEKLLPFAEAILTYYNEHWKRGADGKILFDPHQSIEMYQTGVVNPTPDIAGLRALTERLMRIKGAQGIFPLCQTLQKDLPRIPLGTTQGGKLPLRADAGDKDGKRIILPAEVYGDPSNGENPELYAVFPYRNYCVGKPDLQLALNTFEARRYPFDNCWGQDGMEAALLGITDVAKRAALHAFTTYNQQQKFPWFWAKVADYAPDMDNGGTAMMTLQLMLMQTDGKTIRLIPAWPEDWTADFKLHAPYSTTVEAHVEKGKITRLKVTPKSREKDVIIGRR